MEAMSKRKINPYKSLNSILYSSKCKIKTVNALHDIDYFVDVDGWYFMKGSKLEPYDCFFSEVFNIPHADVYGWKNGKRTDKMLCPLVCFDSYSKKKLLIEKTS